MIISWESVSTRIISNLEMSILYSENALKNGVSTGKNKKNAQIQGRRSPSLFLEKRRNFLRDTRFSPATIAFCKSPYFDSFFS